MKKKIEKNNENELFMQNFINKLIDKTINKKIVWDRENSDDLFSWSYWEDKPNHYFIYSKYCEEDDSNYLYCKSYFHPDIIINAIGDFFRFDIDENDCIYLNYIDLSEDDNELENIELYEIKDGKVINLAEYQQTPFSNCLKKLHDIVDELTSDIYYSESLKTHLSKILEIYNEQSESKAV